eukprot:m.70417 g.70417  ORF g.70417 m.70417 type:complete len:533 (-) comp14161_c0_seq4:32-1630(-)
MAAQPGRTPFGGSIGGNGTAQATANESEQQSQSVAKRQKKKAKKKRKQQLQSIVQESETADYVATSSQPATKMPKSTSRSSQSSQRPWAASPVEVFQWMIQPVEPEVFFRDYWEKKPLLIRRKKGGYYQDLFSSQQLDDIIRKNYIKYGINIDLARYEDGERTTENPEGRVHPNVMWAMYEDGCSIRMLNPQTYAPPVWQLTSTLQEYFQCMVGCNTYLTPQGAQGFAPHYDDIEAFILQLEGEKRWRVYANPTGERLPRTSSLNFDQEDMGQPLLDVVLKPGDMLYFPRGYAHQAVSTEDKHSLHLTVSTYQLFDWAQYMQKLVPAALEEAIASDDTFRAGLPLQTLGFVGLAHAESTDPRRKKFEAKAKQLITRLADHANFDRAADAVAVDFIHASMPPFLTPEETAATSRINHLEAETNAERLGEGVQGTDWIKLLRRETCRLVAENEQAILLYHNYDNGMFWHAEDPQSVEYPVEFAAALEHLIHAEDYVRVNHLPELPEQLQQDIATSLFDAGLVMRQTQEQMEADN